jgi:2-polyprenyl-3-methyl-5-hydroxy-6-metoxy-1,4-benzoquinol methylase
MSDITRIEHYFTRAAADFDALYSVQKQSSFWRWVNKRYRPDIYERYRLTLEHVENNRLKTVLDVGCGSGRYEIGLAKLGVERVLGIDVSPGMIQLAKQSTQEYSSQLEFRVQDFTDFQTSEMFDLVMAMGVFDYIQEPAPVLRRMRALARHSVIASFPSISWYRTPIRKVRYFFKRCPVYFYHQPDIESLAKEAGFVRSEIMKIKGAGQDYFVALHKESA